MFIPSPGTLIASRYELLRVIGRGGMGEIWEAYDRQLGAACAVKFILQHLAQDEGIRQRFLREARALAQLQSPHAVHISSVGEHEQTLYLAMELLRGETLLARLERVGKLSPELTLGLLEQVADALERAHQVGIVHRDLKPDNIWLWSSSKLFVKVLDFGVAKFGPSTPALRTATGSLVGTPYYMSPEQARGTRSVDARSDLWSLAIIAVECLGGRRPFESEGLGDLLTLIISGPTPRLRELAPELPPALESWWQRALARDPAQRFQTAGALVEAFKAQLLAPASERKPDGTLAPVQRPTVPRPPNVLPRPPAPAARWSLGSVTAAASLAAVVIALLAISLRPSADLPSAGAGAVTAAPQVSAAPVASEKPAGSAAAPGEAPPHAAAPDAPASTTPAAGTPAASTLGTNAAASLSAASAGSSRGKAALPKAEPPSVAATPASPKPTRASPEATSASSTSSALTEPATKAPKRPRPQLLAPSSRPSEADTAERSPARAKDDRLGLDRP